MGVYLTEGILTFFLFSTFLAALGIRDSQRGLYCVIMSLFGLLVIAIEIYFNPFQVFANEHWVVDSLSQNFKLLTSIFAILILISTYRYIRKAKIKAFEFYTMFLAVILGLFVVFSSNNFLILFIGLELLSLPIFAMIALFHPSTSREAAIKYFILGAMASGVFLFGVSLHYGISGNLMLVPPSSTLMIQLNTISTALIIIGLLMKLGVSPFHYWVPDVYSGSPLPMLLIISTLPKFAYLAILIRLSINGFLSATPIVVLLLFLSILSIAIGNIGALTQTHFKKLLGYSSISHMGFLLLGLLPGIKSFVPIFYLIIYCISTFTFISVLISLNDKVEEIDLIEHYKGLFNSKSNEAMILLLATFSMAGIPPLAGFMAKLNIFYMLFNFADSAPPYFLTSYYFIGTVAVLLAVIGVAYYIRIVRVLFFEDTSSLVFKYKLNSQALIPAYFTCFLIILFGFFPDQLIDYCQNTLPAIF